MSKRKYTEQQLKDAVESSTSYRQILEKLSLREAGGNYKTLKHYIKELKINTDHLTGQAWLKGKHNPYSLPKKSLDEILIDGSYVQSHKLKKRLLKAGLLENKCYMDECQITNIWNNKPITLRLDHVNGKNDDNRIENLRLVCPNCDSQLPTYCGKNKKKIGKKSRSKIPTGKCLICENNVYGTKYCNQECNHIAQRKADWPTKEELQKLIDDNSFCAIGRIYNVSDNAVRKWAKKFGILKT